MNLRRTAHRLLCALVFVCLPFAIVSCSSAGDVGEECEEAGKTEGECASGGICGKNSAGALICLRVCNDQNQCSAGESCNGVEGSNIKGCRAK